MALVVVGATTAYFSDADKSGVNTLAAGTIEISVNGEGEKGSWVEGFTLDDMKPCYTDYIRFEIKNKGNNPVNIYKNLTNIKSEENGINRPECIAYEGTWEDNECKGDFEAINDIESQINYDLSVEVYAENAAEADPMWHQVIYKDSDNKTIEDIYGQDKGPVYLGMIPVGGSMKVEQSYHMVCSEESQNQYQSDKLSFDIEIEGIQLIGEAFLDNKINADGEPGSVYLTPEDDIGAILTYDVKGSEFNFSLKGKAPLYNTAYVLAAGYDVGSNVDTYLGETISGADGKIDYSDSIELGKHLKDVKVWLVTKDNWDTNHVINWNNMGYYLWETGLIWYEDTDL